MVGYPQFFFSIAFDDIFCFACLLYLEIYQKIFSRSIVMSYSSGRETIDVRRRHDKRAELGTYGEQLAASWLCEQGYTIVAHNVHYRGGEVDLIARDKTGDLVCVEVKTRSTKRWGSTESVDDKKLRRMRGVMAQWLAQSKEYVLDHVPIRFDVIVVFTQAMMGSAEFEHYKAVDRGAC
ncbi:YraN family protein [Corynebacterium sp. sy017]|nr:YraN family protein [Corynebacterium sp. sy017]TSD92404.1 YraN family protein [Corynebacterium sp. SY003]